LQDVLLGYGDPSNANPSSQLMQNFAASTPGVLPPSTLFSSLPSTFLDGAGSPATFTPTQLTAIKSGMSPGLTMIVGPPGTGKTDVATSIIANLYKSYPEQRTVIVTHSNAALNDIFQKVSVHY